MRGVATHLIELEGALPDSARGRGQVRVGHRARVNPTVLVADDRHAEAHTFAGDALAADAQRHALAEDRGLALRRHRR